MTTEKILTDGVIIKLPFKGNALTTVKNGRIAYSQALTLEEYCKEEGDETLKFLTWADYTTLHDEFFAAPFTEITEEQYTDMLECLPPLRWHDVSTRFNIFFCSEADSGCMNGAYVFDRTNKKYYAGTINRFSKDSDILTLLEKL